MAAKVAIGLAAEALARALARTLRGFDDANTAERAWWGGGPWIHLFSDP